jgi:hypothetical protein
MDERYISCIIIGHGGMLTLRNPQFNNQAFQRQSRTKNIILKKLNGNMKKLKKECNLKNKK